MLYILELSYLEKGLLVISYFISSIIFKYLIIDDSKSIYF